MNRSTNPLVLALGSAFAASVVSLLLFAFAFRSVLAREKGDPDQELELAALGERVDALAESLEHRTAEPDVVHEHGVKDALEGLTTRVARMEDAARRRPVAPTAQEASASVAEEVEDTPAGGDAKTLSRDEFTDLLGRVLMDSDSVSPDDQARFWEAARSTGYVDEMLAELEGRIEGDPNDVGARLQLADAYVAKLLTVPAGPERSDSKRRHLSGTTPGRAAQE